MQGREWGLIFVQDLSYSRWANELFLHGETLHYRDLFLAEEVTANIFGYTMGRPMFDMAAMALIGVLLRVVALGALLLLARMSGEGHANLGQALAPLFRCKRAAS